ncbi:MAG: hypothetical protein KJ587_07110 [Alphaproteobacteria bacterium]|nr:hypothetical protein [Alphaproteobacteria bacterium]
MVLSFLAGLNAAAAPSARAGEADVIAAHATRQPDGRYEVSATIRHADDGWDHYADRFDVMTADGQVIGKRVLAHPHVEEQPFTRSLSGVAIPEGVDEIRVRAHDTVHGLGAQEVSVKLTR